MTAIYDVSPRSLSTDSQSLLQHAYFIAAVVIVFAVIILRLIVLRRRNQTVSDFFRWRGNSQYPYGSRPPNVSNYGPMYPSIQLTPLPAAYRPDRRVHAADIDAQGRRLGPAGEGLDGKDVLPAYDSVDRPPKYAEAGWSHGGPPQPMEQSAATPSPEGEQSGIAHPNATNGVSGDNVTRPFDGSNPVAGVSHEIEAAPLSMTHHDLSSS